MAPPGVRSPASGSKREVLLQLHVASWRSLQQSSIDAGLYILVLGIVLMCSLSSCLSSDVQHYMGLKVLDKESGGIQREAVSIPQATSRQSLRSVPIPQSKGRMADGPHTAYQGAGLASVKSALITPDASPAGRRTSIWGRASTWNRSASSASLRPATLPEPSARFTFGARGMSSASLGGTSTRMSARDLAGPLCPCLAVPDGMELVFAVRDLLTHGPQQVSFSIVDLGGQPLCHVIVNESGVSYGILVQMLDQTPLAYVRTDTVHGGAGLPEICRPSGEVFCSVIREEGPPASFALRSKSGQLLYTIQGDVRERVVNFFGPDGRVVCDTEPCAVDFDSSLYYQVRVAPRTDACLMLCALLALSKSEGSGRG